MPAAGTVVVGFAGNVSVGKTTELSSDDRGKVRVGRTKRLVVSVVVPWTGLVTETTPVLVRVTRTVVSAAEEMMVVRKVVGIMVAVDSTVVGRVLDLMLI